MFRIALLFGTTLTLLFAPTERALAHCQIPCGIYNDAARVAAMREDAATIDKSVKLIRQLTAKRDAQSKNQLIRWVTNKEHHAERIIRTIADYFMAQKIKPASAGDRGAMQSYMTRLAKHHAVIVAAMHCKQNAAPDKVRALKKAIDAIAGYWK